MPVRRAVRSVSGTIAAARAAVAVAVAVTVATVATQPAAAAEAALRVLRITPAGLDVPAGRQIVVTFDRPVVAIGRMERQASEIPVTISPALRCEWRWLDQSNLACQLGADGALAPATRYRLQLGAGLVALDGTRLEGVIEHTFVTRRPDLEWVGFRTWRGPTTPVLRAGFNLPVTHASAGAHLFVRLDAAGAPRIPVHAYPEPADDADPRTLPVPASARIWLLEPVEALAADATYRLEVEPGLVTPGGSEPGAAARTRLTFDTFPALAFLGVRCTDIAAEERVLIPASSPLAEQPRCDPLSGVALAFSVPVLAEQVKAHLELAPDLAGGRKDYDPWANRTGWSRLGQPHRRGDEYLVWLPERLRAFEEYDLRIGAGGLADEFGRTLAEPGLVRFMTAHRHPDITYPHQTAVLESGVDSEVPLYVTNLDRIDARYRRLTAQGSGAGEHAVELPEVEDIAFAVPFGVREMLAGRSGAVSGELRTTPPPRYADPLEFFAEVTPYQVHVKLGHFSSIAWVTSLATGEPVAGAEVSVYRDTEVSLTGGDAERPVSAQTDAQGLAHLPGTVTLDPQLTLVQSWSRNEVKLFVRVERDGEIAVLPLDGRFRQWSRGVSSYARKRFGHMRAWGTTAQGVYRAGDAVQYKLWVRDQDDGGLTAARRDGYRLEVFDPKGERVHLREAIALSAFGAVDGEVPIAPDAAVGWYRFVLSAAFTDETFEPLRVLVSDFTPSPFKVRTELAGTRFGPGDAVRVSTLATLHSGGPYVDASTRVTARLRARTFTSSHPLAAGFRFDSALDPGGWTPVHQGEGTLDAGGALETDFTLPDAAVIYGTLQVESAVRDDRGKSVAGLARADYLGRDRLVGLRNTRWLYREGETARVEFIVVNADGAPIGAVPAALSVERRVTRAARVKGAGNAYLTRTTSAWELVSTCEATSDAAAPGACAFTPPAPGAYRITARVTDGRGRVHASTIGAWATGAGAVQWEDEGDGALSILAESTAPEVGDVARFLVRNPYPGARALVTVERYGVLDARVETFESSTPVVEVPIGPEHVPGFYLSVVVASPRVDAPLGDEQVDLGKPAQRAGYLAVPVDDPVKRMRVTVAPEREEYEPRERARVNIEARPRDGSAAPAAEIAVAVLDDSVFDLIASGKRYFDPYAGFHGLGPLDVANYALIERLVGRQRFERKGESAGGDGGGDLSFRSILDYVAYWNPAIGLDASGRAEIAFDLPDNLTGWRVLAMAATETDRFGLGDAVVRVNKPTELRPVMPNQASVGDRFDAGFNVLNRSDTARELAVTIVAEGALATGPVEHRETVRLAPYARRTISIPVRASAAGEIRFTASAADAVDADGLRHAVTVRARRTLEAAASYGSTTEARAEVAVEVPADALADVGGFSLVLSPTVIGNVDGAFRYMRDYPYACWEQKLSKGVMASHYEGLRAYLPPDVEWPGASELPAETLRLASRYQTPSGAMAYWVARDEYASPYLSAYTALAFTWLREAGHAIPSDVESRLHGYLDRMLRRDLMPGFYSRGMASTVRAVALAALAASGNASVADLERYVSHVPYMSLFGKAWFHDAAARVPGAEALAASTLDAILAHASVSAGKVALDEPAEGADARILASATRSGCALLGTLARAELTGRAGAAADVSPRLVRALTQARGRRDAWENTQENTFCAAGLVAYARAFERVEPRLSVRALVDGEAFGQAAFEGFADPPVTLERALRPADRGTPRTLSIERQGEGRVYYSARVRFARDDAHATRANAGIDLRREYSVRREGRWVLLESPMAVVRGELVRVDLYLSLPTARHFVVVDDPIPGGLEPVNTDLATASTLDAEAGERELAGGAWWYRHDDWRGYGSSRWSFYHRELRHDAARFFSDYLPPGNYHLGYSVQAVATGRFAVAPAKAEEMYDPDVFGRGLPATLSVSDE